MEPGASIGWVAILALGASTGYSHLLSNRLGSSHAGSNIPGGLNRTGTDNTDFRGLGDHTDRFLAGTSWRVNNGMSLVTTSLLGFYQYCK